MAAVGSCIQGITNVCESRSSAWWSSKMSLNISWSWSRQSSPRMAKVGYLTVASWTLAFLAWAVRGTGVNWLLPERLSASYWPDNLFLDRLCMSGHECLSLRTDLTWWGGWLPGLCPPLSALWGPRYVWKQGTTVWICLRINWHLPKLLAWLWYDLPCHRKVCACQTWSQSVNVHIVFDLSVVPTATSLS